MFVCLLRDNSRKLQHITKLDTDKDHGSLQKPMFYLGHRSNNEVMTLKSRSNFEIAITPFIFKLQHRSMAQNVGNALGYWGNILNFRWHFWPKFDIRYEKIITNSHRKSIADAADVTHDVTAWRQIQSSIFIFKWNSHIFHNTGHSFWPIITNLGPHMKNGPTHQPVVYLFESQITSEWMAFLGSITMLPDGQPPQDSGQRYPYSPYKPCNHSLYIGIIIK